jgi:hypothetical protein
VFRSRNTLIALYIILALAIVACGTNQDDQLETLEQDSATAESNVVLGTESPFTVVAADESTGVIVGQLDNMTGPMPDDVYIWTVKLLRSPEGYGIFALNTLTTPSFLIDSGGYFQAFPIEPGEYVLIIGTSPESAAAITREDGQAKPFEVFAGEVLDIGKQTIALYLPPPIEDRPTPGYPPPQPTTEPSYP